MIVFVTKSLDAIAWEWVYVGQNDEDRGYFILFVLNK